MPNAYAMQAHTTVFRDIDDMPRPNEIDALVASGDFFIMAATKLDGVTDELGDEAAVVRPQIEHLVGMFLYMQRHYHIVRKRPDYRQ